MVCETTVEEIPDRILVLRRKNPLIFILQPGACGRSPVPHTGGVTTTTTTTTTTYYYSYSYSYYYYYYYYYYYIL